MKKITNNIFTVTVAILVLLSCRDESVIRIPSFDAAPNVRIVPDASTTSINFFGDLTKASVKFDIYSQNKNLQLVDIRVVRTSAGVNSDTVSAVTFTQADFDKNAGVIKGTVITLPQLAILFKLPGGVTSFKGADLITFLNYTTMKNGMVYPSKTVGGNINLSPTIVGANASTSFTTNFLVALTCPSSIIEGTYTATQDDADVWFGGPNPLPSTNQVTITKVAGTANQYLLSDISAGGYFACCGPGFKLNQPAIIQDVCLSILVVGGSGAQITIGQGVTAGSWNAATKTLIVHYDDVTNHSKALGFDLMSKFVKN